MNTHAKQCSQAKAVHNGKTNIFEMKCSLCPKMFTSKKALDSHKLKSHPGSNVPLNGNMPANLKISNTVTLLSPATPNNNTHARNGVLRKGVQNTQANNEIINGETAAAASEAPSQTLLERTLARFMVSSGNGQTTNQPPQIIVQPPGQQQQQGTSGSGSGSEEGDGEGFEEEGMDGKLKLSFLPPTKAFNIFCLLLYSWNGKHGRNTRRSISPWKSQTLPLVQ
jgi:hypothetical protein